MLSPANWQGSLVEDFPSAKGKNEEGTEMEREFVSLWSRVTPLVVEDVKSLMLFWNTYLISF